MTRSASFVPRRRAQIAGSVAAIALVAMVGCGSSSYAASEEWCDLVAESAELLGQADEVNTPTSTDAEIEAQLQDVYAEIQVVGWPRELQDEERVFARGPQASGTSEREAYDDALTESEAFVRRECGLPPEAAEAFFRS